LQNYAFWEKISLKLKYDIITNQNIAKYAAKSFSGPILSGQKLSKAIERNKINTQNQ